MSCGFPVMAKAASSLDGFDAVNRIRPAIHDRLAPDRFAVTKAPPAMMLQRSRETSGPVKLVPDRGTHLWEQLRLEPGIALLPADTTPRRMRGREDGRSETLEGADTIDKGFAGILGKIMLLRVRSD